MEKKIDFHQIPEIIREILDKRGVKGKENIEKFLFPRLADLPEPSLMQGLDKAVDIIIDYLSTGRRIIIWGDYDVDGTTGTALLVTFFKKLGRMVDWHIPNRLEEGYGLNAGWFHKQKKNSGGR
jgi:single-stranded-DNA-specific exonuclease